MGSRIRLLIAGVFVLILAALAFYNNQEKVKYTVPNNAATPPLQSLPEFSAVDIFGDKISTANIKGKNVFIQFIDPKSESQNESLKRIYRDFKNEKLIIMVFLKDSNSHIFDRFMDEMRFAFGNITIITEKYEDYKKTFNAPSCCEKFYLFNESGNLIASGLNWRLYTSETLGLFGNMEIRKKFSILNFIKPGENINNISWFTQVVEIIRKDSKYNNYIISMFNELCNTCLNGQIINNLMKSYEENHGSSYYLIMLSDNFSENDINNFKKFLKIRFPVVIAEESLSAKWYQLAEEFGKSKLNNLVFFINRNGDILSLMDPHNQDDFFDYINFVNKTNEYN